MSACYLSAFHFSLVSSLLVFLPLLLAIIFNMAQKVDKKSCLYGAALNTRKALLFVDNPGFGALSEVFILLIILVITYITSPDYPR